MSGEEDFLRPLVGLVVQEVLEAEMSEALGAQKGERTEGRLGYRSGYYVRSLVTRVGKLELRVPQDRQGRFCTQLFERYQRSEKALVAALAEMYVQGVSTRKVKAITEELCGQEFSASSISAINQRLDEELERFMGGGSKSVPSHAIRGTFLEVIATEVLGGIGVLTGFKCLLIKCWEFFRVAGEGGQRPPWPAGAGLGVERA